MNLLKQRKAWVYKTRLVISGKKYYNYTVVIYNDLF